MKWKLSSSRDIVWVALAKVLQVLLLLEVKYGYQPFRNGPRPHLGNLNGDVTLHGA